MQMLHDHLIRMYENLTRSTLSDERAKGHLVDYANLLTHWANAMRAASEGDLKATDENLCQACKLVMDLKVRRKAILLTGRIIRSASMF